MPVDESWNVHRRSGPRPSASRISRRAVMPWVTRQMVCPVWTARRASRPWSARARTAASVSRARPRGRRRGLAPRPMGVGEARVHLVTGEALPVAEAHLLERRRLLHRQALGRRDDGRGVPGPRERARPHRGQRGVGEQARGGLRLGPSRRGERDVAPALEAPLPVPVRLARAATAGAHVSPRRSTFWAARTPAPKSTGCPSSCSTCSSAASAVITSNSAT